MRKITLDFGDAASVAALSRREIHEYIAEKMAFPDYYGHNLDALYDCLTDITEPTAVGLAIPASAGDPADADTEPQQPSETMTDGGEIAPRHPGRHASFNAAGYLLKVRKAFADAEADNPNLAVFDLTGMAAGPEE